jgi:hypothetical protein
MFSRKNTILLADIIANVFTDHKNERQPMNRGYKWVYRVETDRLYDFLYENDYQAWFCNLAKAQHGHSDSYSSSTRNLKEFILRLHTGETQVNATPNWRWEQRQELGQQYLRNLAEDILNSWYNEWSVKTSPPISEDRIQQLLHSLELDGYSYKDERLLSPEEDVLNVEAETTLLENLYTSLGLENSETAFHHLQLSADHYEGECWDDSISNSRKFLECVLKESANCHSRNSHGESLTDTFLESPGQIRRYLEDERLLETKEKEAIASVYSLLSHTGGHPYMAEKDQARLLRHLSLTLSQFVMLRLQGSLSQYKNGVFLN